MTKNNLPPKSPLSNAFKEEADIDERRAEMAGIFFLLARNADPALMLQLMDVSKFLLPQPLTRKEFDDLYTILTRAGVIETVNALVDHVDSFSDDATGFKSSGISLAEKAAALKANKPKN